MCQTILFSVCAFFAWFSHLYATEPSSQPIVLQVQERDIVVNGKKSQVYAIVQPNGTQGLFLKKGDQFNVVVENRIPHPTGIHWHGLILPNNQDGVPYVTQPPILPGEQYAYNFLLIQAGSFWMHAHYGLQEQKLLTAPLILYEPSQQQNETQDIVMFLSDFTFKNPLAIFQELQTQHAGMSSMKPMDMKADLNDVQYDAFLANWRTLSDPDVIQVTPNREVRVRVINGSSSTNFFIDLGHLVGEVIAIDGSDILPIRGSHFEVAVAQRLDFRLKIPSGKGSYPILARGEGTQLQTGLILATPEARIPSLPEKREKTAKAFSYKQERILKAKDPLPQKAIDRRVLVNLEGDMMKYIWTINNKAWPDHTPLMVKQGERVELVFVNKTDMSHPMHLHGHAFQVTEINGQVLQGALRDTILVLPKSTVKVQFDANNPGVWPLHCHNLYHQYAGMMTTLNYEGFKGPTFKIPKEEH